MATNCTGIFCGALLWVIPIILVVGLLVFGQLFARLEVFHNLLWRKLGSPGFMMKVGIPGNLTSWFRVTWFIWTERVSVHRDPILTRIVWKMRVLGLVAVAALIYSATVLYG